MKLNGYGLIISWKEAFHYLTPKSLGLFFLLALRKLLQTYWALLYAWFFPTALLAGLVLNNKGLLAAFYISLLVRAARPSIERKTTAYWQEINVIDWVIFFGLLILFEIPFIMAGRIPVLVLKLYDLLLQLFFLKGHMWLPGATQLGVVTIVISPLVIVWGLFLADAQKTPWHYLKAFGRAILMLTYNYPFFLVMYEALRLGIAACFMLAYFFPHSSVYVNIVGWTALIVFFIPFYVCFLTSFYVKRLHDQMSFYYKL